MLIVVHGGVKVYRGSAAAARHYVEADRGRADDYYLAEGTGIADRYTATPTDGVRAAGALTGEMYEAWVSGYDPETGVAKGRVRNDERAVRFVEVVVNGPKTWSLAAALHPDVSAAYDAAQEAAARQIIDWLAQHATTRVGPRGAQVQVPVRQIDAVTIRHYSSRAGDPHRHLHLQINARILAEGCWRGLHTLGVRDAIDALNGIGHAAVMTDPGFRAALAAHGFTLDPGTGEVVQLTEFVGPFSARTAQIGRNIDRYEAEWRAANPGVEPGPGLRRAWDARAWAEARPDKIVPRDGAELTARWVAELRELGYRDSARPVRLEPASVGRIDRDLAVAEVLTRLAARRSGWNVADIRGEVEQLIARSNVVTAAGVRGELAEDLTARTAAACVPLFDRDGVPEHIRALTSRHVLSVEADLTSRLAARADTHREPSHATREDTLLELAERLDAAQRHAVRALAGDPRLVVVEGAAGAGKTATLAATRAALERDGHRLLVVTPTRKAAGVAAREVGTRAFSAAWLAHQHGYRWDEHGTWTRLAPGDTDPTTGTVYAGPSADALLRPGDLLLVDEAGMLDQDTARALFTLADERQVRVALVGDRHQLPAVGRGGVLDLAVRWTLPDAVISLDTVHRFTRTHTGPDGTHTTIPDEEYARLSLAMRTGEQPETVFDALLARGQIRLYGSDLERRHALAASGVGGGDAALIGDTLEQVALLNAAIRDQLVTAGRVNDERVVCTAAGQRIGAGDRVATRRNDTDLAVANRDAWTVTGVGADGSLTLAGEPGTRTVPNRYAREHVELAYASTVHGAQGATTSQAHALLGEHSSAASAYVALTRGRETNVAHMVADSVEDAREQWCAIFARDRADLGPAHAAQLAATEAARYAPARPLHLALGELRQAWTVEQDLLDRLAEDEQRRELLREIVPLRAARDTELPPLEAAYEHARALAQHARQPGKDAEALLASETARIRDTLLDAWDEQRREACRHAEIIRAGTGRFGRGRAAITHATEQVQRWADSWRRYLPDLPTDQEQLVDDLLWFDQRAERYQAFDQVARRQAEHEHPDAVATISRAARAAEAASAAFARYNDRSSHYYRALGHFGNLARTDDPAQLLTRLEQRIDDTTSQLTAAQHQVAGLLAEPALRALPSDRIAAERDRWHADRDLQYQDQHAAAWDIYQGHAHEPYRPTPSLGADRSPGISM